MLPSIIFERLCEDLTPNALARMEADYTQMLALASSNESLIADARLLGAEAVGGIIGDSLWEVYAQAALPDHLKPSSPTSSHYLSKHLSGELFDTAKRLGENFKIYLRDSTTEQLRTERKG